MRKRTTRDFSKAQETKVSKDLNLKVQSNSGATPFEKGDVKGTNILLECKTLMKVQTQRTIHKSWLTGIKKEQYQMGKKMSGVVFDFGDGDNYVVLSIKDFKELIEVWERELEE